MTPKQAIFGAVFEEINSFWQKGRLFGPPVMRQIFNIVQLNFTLDLTPCLIWERKINRDVDNQPGMHGAAFFSFGARQAKAEEKILGVGRGGVTVKLRAFWGWGGAGQF